MTVTVHLGDSRDILKTLADASVDSCVCDPPYALVSIVKRFGKPGSAPANGDVYARASSGFMGQAWDTGDTAFDPDFWREVLRVLKPGGHVVAFGGTRTYHRLVCAIEDAGFEIRDQLAWIYGSGFPKSHDVSRGIQKRRTEDLEPIRVACRALRAAMDARGLVSRQMSQHFGDCHPRLIDHWAARDTDSQPALPTWEQWLTLKTVLALDDNLDAEVWRLNGRKGSPGQAWTDAEIIGEHAGQTPGLVGKRFAANDKSIRAASAEAVEWEGWGTALKPALEPICLARKPLSGTVAGNVLAHGTGALNIDGCRVGDEERYAQTGRESGKVVPPGRWPANVVHDGSDEVVERFPAEAGGGKPGKPGKPTISALGVGLGTSTVGHEDSGSAARFFYSAKADAEDRLGSAHPTVKPVDLMAWLCRLVTPPGGTVLDPFAGSGTTGLAALGEGFDAILIEREPKFHADIERRLAWAKGEGRLTKSESARKRRKTPAPGMLAALEEDE